MVWILSLQLLDQQRLLVAAAEPGLGRDSSPVLAASAGLWFLHCNEESAEVGKEGERNELPLPRFSEKQGGGLYLSSLDILSIKSCCPSVDVLMVVPIGIMDHDDGYSHFTKG